MNMTLLYLSIPIILTFHEIEEWNILIWYKKHFIDPPPSDNLAVRTWILFCSLVGFLWTLISVWIPNNHITAFFMSLLILVTIQNAIQHIYWQILFRAYSPGVIFSTIGLILGVYVIFKETNAGYLPLWFDLLFLIALIPTTIETIRAKNTMTESVLKVHHFGIKLAYLLWIK